MQIEHSDAFMATNYLTLVKQHNNYTNTQLHTYRQHKINSTHLMVSNYSTFCNVCVFDIMQTRNITSNIIIICLMQHSLCIEAFSLFMYTEVIKILDNSLKTIKGPFAFTLHPYYNISAYCWHYLWLTWPRYNNKLCMQLTRIGIINYCKNYTWTSSYFLR